MMYGSWFFSAVFFMLFCVGVGVGSWAFAQATAPPDREAGCLVNHRIAKTSQKEANRQTTAKVKPMVSSVFFMGWNG